MKKCNKIIIIVFLLLIFIPYSKVLSHQQDVIGWGEEIGWIVNQTYHQLTNTIEYKVYKGETYTDSDLSDDKLTAIVSAVTEEEEAMIHSAVGLWTNNTDFPGYAVIEYTGETYKK